MFIKMVSICLAATFMLSCTGNRSEGKEEKSNTSEHTSMVKAQSGDMYLLAGTYTSVEGSKGIYIYRFNTETGRSDSLSLAEADNPSYLTLSPNEDFVYAVSENGGDKGGVYSFSFDKEKGELVPINFQSTLSGGPCYITIDSNGKYIHTANYGGGSISSFQVNSDGSITTAKSVMSFEGTGPDSTRQESPHLHSVMFSPNGDYLFAADLGSDKLYRFNVINSTFEGQPNIDERSLEEIILPPGTGPRHFTFHPDGNYLYLLGELSGEVLVFDYNNGDINQKQTVVADSVGARSSADIHVSPDGRFLYASNRSQADGIAIFSIDANDGTLTRIGYQLTARHPRNFVITPNGKFLLVAGSDDNKIQVFEINSDTGLLIDTNQDILIDKPVCLKLATMQ